MGGGAGKSVSICLSVNIQQYYVRLLLTSVLPSLSQGNATDYSISYNRMDVSDTVKLQGRKSPQRSTPNWPLSARPLKGFNASRLERGPLCRALQPTANSPVPINGSIKINYCFCAGDTRRL